MDPFQKITVLLLVDAWRLLPGLSAHTALRNLLLGKVVHLVNDECATIYWKNSGSEQVSLFHKMPFSALQEFKLAACVKELEDKCPFLYCLFTIIIVRHSDHRNTNNKCGSNHIPGVCMCIAILLERNREMSSIQTYISLALFSRVQKRYVIQNEHFEVHAGP